MSGVQKLYYVVGFGPFGSHQVNASWECVKLLQEKGLGEDVELVVYEIPVEYATVKKMVPNFWNNHKPDVGAVFVCFSPLWN